MSLHSMALALSRPDTEDLHNQQAASVAFIPVAMAMSPFSHPSCEGANCDLRPPATTSTYVPVSRGSFPRPSVHAKGRGV